METINTIERLPLATLVDIKAPVKRVGINAQVNTVLKDPVRLVLGDGVQLVVAADLLDAQVILNGDLK